MKPLRMLVFVTLFVWLHFADRGSVGLSSHSSSSWSSQSFLFDKGSHFRTEGDETSEAGIVSKDYYQIQALDNKKGESTPTAVHGSWSSQSFLFGDETSEAGIVSEDYYQIQALDNKKGESTPTAVHVLSGEFRLAGSSYQNEGRIEYRHNPDQSWGTICDSSGLFQGNLNHFCYLHKEKNPCLQLGYLGHYTYSYALDRYDQTDGPIWFYGLTCTSTGVADPNQCIFADWSLPQASCDHNKDVAVLCVTDKLRLSGGCSSHEGMVQVDMGSTGWTTLNHLTNGLTAGDADLACRHFGFPLAIAHNNACVGDQQDFDLSSFTLPTACQQNHSSILDCISDSLTYCGLVDSDNAPPALDQTNYWSVVCATDDDVIATNVDVTDLFEVRLVNGSSQLTGILELRLNGSTWAPACFYDEIGNLEVAGKVCFELNQNCVVDVNLILQRNNRNLEYLFRADYFGNVYWLGVESRCHRHGGYNMEIICTADISLNGVTVHISPEQTCLGRCGDLPTRHQCGCDAMCHVFQECCYDFDSVCPATNGNHTGLKIGGSLKDSGYYQCLPLNSDEYMTYRMVSICPESWQDDVIRHFCEFPPTPQPVLYLPLNISFKNLMCAYCHEVVQMSLNEDEVTNATVHTLMMTPELNMFRSCNNLSSSCDRDNLTESCGAYIAPYVDKFKNPHCALCNDIDVNVCRALNRSKQPPHEPDFKSISHDLVSLSYDVSQHFQTITLDVPIKCMNKQVILKTTNKPTFSSAEAMKCLIYAVGYSDVVLALPFSQALQYLLDSHTQNFVSDTTATIASSQVAVDGFEQIFDAILLFGTGGVKRTDWPGRCGLLHVSLIDKCVLQLPQNGTSSPNSTECFYISEGGWVSMNISGKLVVYEIDNGTLINPASTSALTEYDVGTSIVGKREVFRFCGERETSLTCETLSVFNRKFSANVPSQESMATLPNGETIVCYAKPQLELFSRPEQIVNLVCFSLSLAGLTATLITYSVFSTLRNAHGLAVMSLSLAILIAQLSSILSQVVANLSIRGLCSAFAVITHYFWLSAFSWMAAMSWDFMRTFSGISSAKTNTSLRKFRRLCLVAWCSPLLVIIPHLILHFCECTGLDFSYGSEVSCWIANKWAIFIMFCVPVILCICFNVACFAWTVRCIRSSLRASSMVRKDKPKELWGELLIYVKMSTVMSFTWILGFVGMVTDIDLVWYLFAVLSSLQGVYVFLAFAFSGRVRAMWRDKLRRKDEPSSGASRRQPLDNKMKVKTGLETQM